MIRFTAKFKQIRTSAHRAYKSVKVYVNSIGKTAFHGIKRLLFVFAAKSVAYEISSIRTELQIF